MHNYSRLDSNASIFQYSLSQVSIHLSIHQSILFLGVFCDKLQTRVHISASFPASLPLSSEPCFFTALFFRYELDIQWHIPDIFPQSLFLIEVYNIVLISVLQQSDSVIHIYVYIYIVCVCVCVCVFGYAAGHMGLVPWPGIEPTPPAV